MDRSHKRKHSGRDYYKFIAAIAQKLININNKYWGALSYKRFAGKLMEAGIDVVPEIVRTRCRESGMVRRRQYIKPKLTVRDKIDRLQFVLDQMNSRSAKFTNLENVVHEDEKCFFNDDGRHCVPCLPQHEGRISAACTSTRVPKIANAYVSCCLCEAKTRIRLQWENWSFTHERPAMSSLGLLWAKP